ncbi:hypothetical protein FGO68_gene558 [Halteria grandinella]|uniref:Protein kinase domain-containing protein n=1 Tax=Halteria grandinella TaxID=5974 RepID=A0A8J8NH32_HALGN|nr:hypothetical protein FGO68_gene558 [Halteria grandinella]
MTADPSQIFDQSILNNDADQQFYILGEGSFGKVFKAIDILTNQEVAIKQLKKSQLLTEEDIANVKMEIELLRLVSCGGSNKIKPAGELGIVKLIDSFEDDEHINIVMEYFQGQTLYQWLSDRSKGPENPHQESQLVPIFQKVLKSLSQIHNLGIAHRDIKLDNILIRKKDGSGEENWEVKLIDFGLSAVFMPGEVSKNTQVEHTMLNILNKPLNFNQPCWQGKSPLIKEVVARMLHKEQRKRITIEGCLKLLEEGGY